MKGLKKAVEAPHQGYGSVVMDEDPTQPLPPPPPPQYGPPVPPRRTWDAQEPFYRRHGLAFAIATAVLAGLLLLVMVGVGAFAVTSVIARAAHTVSQSQHIQAGPGHGNGGGQKIPGPPGAPRGNGGLKQGLGVVRGTVESVTASKWTVATPNGTTVTVVVTPQTVFGTLAGGGSASHAVRGDQVVVLGKRSGDTIVAVRILTVGAPGSPTTPTPGPSATPGK